MIVCSRPEDGLRCRQGVKPPLKLKTRIMPRIAVLGYKSFYKEVFLLFQTAVLPAGLARPQ